MASMAETAASFFSFVGSAGAFAVIGQMQLSCM
jgi:hypothetical protein